MEIAAATQMAMTMKRAEIGQDLSILAMKQSLQQDAGVLQIIAAAAQPPAQPSPLPASGPGQVLDITV